MVEVAPNCAPGEKKVKIVLWLYCCIPLHAATATECDKKQIPPILVGFCTFCVNQQQQMSEFWKYK